MGEVSSLESIAAVTFLTLGKNDYVHVLEEFNVSFENEQEAASKLRSSHNLTENQRIALFSYAYLYKHVQKKELDNLDELQRILVISKGVKKNVEMILTQKRMDYIEKFYKNKNQKFWSIFLEPADFIVKLIDDVVSAQVQEEKLSLKGLQASEYEHPRDKAALEALKSQPTLSEVMKLFNQYTVEKLVIANLTGSNFLVTEESMPYAYNALKEVCEALNVYRIPKLYIEHGLINAYTVGTKEPIISLSSACLSLLTYDELLFILGHEVGHIKSGHFLYRSMVRFLPTIARFFPVIGKLLSTGLQVALSEWYRKSELTADRAGLLACQNPNAAFTFFTKVSGYPMKYYPIISKDLILKQAREFEGLDSETFSKVAKMALIMDKSHPWTIMRAKELDNWIEDGAYGRIMKSKTSYHKRKDEESNSKVDIKITFKK